MGKKKIQAVALIIIVANLLNQIFSNWAFSNGSPSSLLFINLCSSIGIFPRGFPLLLHYFPNSVAMIGMNLVNFWPLVMIAIGVGILLEQNIARIILIIYSIVHIITYIFSRLLMHHFPIKHYLSGNPLVDVLISLNAKVFVVLIPILYIIFFTHPKAKEQFK